MEKGGYQKVAGRSNWAIPGYLDSGCDVAGPQGDQP